MLLVWDCDWSFGIFYLLKVRIGTEHQLLVWLNWTMAESMQESLHDDKEVIPTINLYIWDAVYKKLTVNYALKF